MKLRLRHPHPLPLTVLALNEGLRAGAKRWGAAFPTATLGIDDDCLSLEPWRLAVCGDFVGGGPTPAEAAAASGLAAGERIAQIFA